MTCNYQIHFVSLTSLVSIHLLESSCTQVIFVIITALRSHYSITLSLHAQNLPFQLIAGLDLTCHAHRLFSVHSFLILFTFRLVDLPGYSSAARLHVGDGLSHRIARTYSRPAYVLTAIIIACYNWYNQDCTRVHPSTRHCTRRDNQTIRELGTVATLRHSLGQQPTTADCQVPSTDNKREAQISRRGHWMFRVTEYFAKSLKVIGNSIVQKLEYRFLFAFHSNYRYGGIFGCFDTIHECDRQTPSQPVTA